MTTRVKVSPLRIRDRESKPVDDWVDIGRVRIHNRPRPWSRPPSPHLQGNPVGQIWERRQVVALSNPLTGLDQAIPMVVIGPDGVETVRQLRYQAGQSSEEAYLDRFLHVESPGPRGDNLTSPYVTYRASLMTDPPGTLWTGISIGGFLYHRLPDGRCVALTGYFTDPDVIPSVGNDDAASSSYWHGDFGGPGSDDGAPLLHWKMPQDLWIREEDSPDPIARGIYVVDTKNNRVTITTNVARTPKNPLGMKTRTYVDGLNDPCSIDIDLVKGRMYISERAGQKITAVDMRASNPNANKRTLAVIPGRPFSLRLTSRGNLTTVEYVAPRNLLDINSETGAVRVIRQCKNTQGQLNTKWLWHDTDRYGCWGPVDDSIVVQTGSYQHMSRIAYDGVEILDARGNSNEQFAPHRQGVLSIGPVRGTGDPIGHYPWAFSGSRHFDEWITTGMGSTGDRLWPSTLPGDPIRNDWSNTLYSLGRQVNQDDGFPLDPSFWPANGTAMWHFLGGLTREDVIRLPHADFNEFLRRSARGVVPHTNLSDAQCRGFRYLLWCNSDLIWQHGLKPAAMDAYAGAPPPPPPPPVGFQVGARIRVTNAVGGLNVRTGPGTSFPKVGPPQPNGNQGVLIAGPQPSIPGGLPWWNINYDNGSDGWSSQAYLEVVSEGAG